MNTRNEPVTGKTVSPTFKKKILSDFVGYRICRFIESENFDFFAVDQSFSDKLLKVVRLFFVIKNSLFSATLRTLGDHKNIKEH